MSGWSFVVLGVALIVLALALFLIVEIILARRQKQITEAWRKDEIGVATEDF